MPSEMNFEEYKWEEIHFIWERSIDWSFFFLAELNVHIDQCMWPIYFDQIREIEKLKKWDEEKKKKA